MSMKWNGEVKRDDNGPGFTVAVELTGIATMEQARQFGAMLHDAAESWLASKGARLAIGSKPADSSGSGIIRPQ